MGQKVSPISFRLGQFKNWQSKWFAKKGYQDLLYEDIKLRELILKKFPSALISKIEIERDKNLVILNIQTARPGMIIGRQGTGTASLRELLKKQTKSEIKINIEEVKEPDLDAYLIACNIALQIEKRISYKRAIKQAIDRVRTAKAKGGKIKVSGRLGGVEIARHETHTFQKLPLATLKADIDYGQKDALTTYGVIGVKVWIYK